MTSAVSSPAAERFGRVVGCQAARGAALHDCGCRDDRAEAGSRAVLAVRLACCRTRRTPGLDLVGVALTFFSVQVSDRPADEDHTYGHGKFENLSAFGEARLMAISCAWIIWEAMLRIFPQTVELRHSLWPVLVLLDPSPWTTGVRGG